MFKPRYHWGDNDKYFGPFTYARDKHYKPTSLMLSSPDEDDTFCTLRVSAFGHTLILFLPPIIKPYREKVHAKDWSPADIERMGRDWYWDFDRREFGFSITDGFLNIAFGRQSDDSSTERRWGYFLPWTQWRHVRHSLYDLDGKHFWTEPKHAHGEPWNWEEQRAIEGACPSAVFEFDDFDGERLHATTRLNEREWRFGEGWFKWLSLFAKPKISRSLGIEFSGETGRRKGSWKGGTIGHSIEVEAGETHEQAFRRYCNEHDMKFVGAVREAIERFGPKAEAKAEGQESED
jgi:hypothetical protein